MKILSSIIIIFLWIYLTVLLCKLFVRILPYCLYFLNRLLCLILLICLLTLNFTGALIVFVIFMLSEALRRAIIRPAILAMLKKMGMGTAEQIAKQSKNSIEDTTETLKGLAEKGRIEAVRLANGVAYKLHGDNITGENFTSSSTEIEIN